MEKFKRLFTDKTMLFVFIMGFASGLPLLLIGSTLQAWGKESGLNLSQLGMMSWIGIPYSIKFLWSPILDRFVPKFLGRRRGWIAITQVALMIALVALAVSDLKVNTTLALSLAILVAFLSATQDIGIDAYRREILPDSALAFGNSLYVTGYRMGMLLAGAGALMLADAIPWRGVYITMAASMGLGLIITFLCKEPVLDYAPPRSLRESVVEPFKEFFSRPGALWILAFIVLYKLGDNMAASISTPFYLELGYTKTQIGAIVKVFGVWATIFGGIIGGTIIVYIGLRRALWVFGILQGVSVLGLTALDIVARAQGPSNFALAAVITGENLAIGMGTAAYSAFMAALTNRRFTATQYALLSSLMAVTRVVTGPSGWIAERLGWQYFFVFSALLAIPGLLLLLKIGKWAEEA